MPSKPKPKTDDTATRVLVHLPDGREKYVLRTQLAALSPRWKRGPAHSSDKAPRTITDPADGMSTALQED